MALANLWMVYVGEARAVAEVTAALVDAGGLALACDVKYSMVAVGEWLAGSPCYELVRRSLHCFSSHSTSVRTCRVEARACLHPGGVRSALAVYADADGTPGKSAG